MQRTMQVAVTLLTLLMVTACAIGGTSEITWEDSIEEALALSERDGKPVLLYFTFHG